jgi:WD40 repeat protein
MGDAGGLGAAKVDFFISYTAADQDVAEWIAWVLEDAGYQTVIQAWDFRPGREFVTEMQQALVRAQRVVAVLSAAYLRSDFARQEWNAALASDPSGTAGRLVPVRVAEVDLQGLDQTRVYLDLVGLAEEEAKARLLDGVKPGRAKPIVEPSYPVRLGQRPAAVRVTESVVAGSMIEREFRAHWDPRARGVPLASDLGWYFAGRTRVLRELVTWMSDPDLDHRARVVTGDPGSGKSAVLARLVTLADPQVRQRVPQAVLTAAPAGTLPPPGGIDAAIHARNKALPDVLAALATATGIVHPDTTATVTSPERQVRNLIDQLIAQPQRRVVILDALDEAIDSEQLVSKLLVPLLEAAPQSGLRLLVGTRRPLVDALGDRIVVLDLDGPSYLHEADLAEYVTRVLLAEHEPDRPTPYRGRRELAEQVARAVAGRAHKTFLLARIVAQSLISDDNPVDTSRSGWELQLPATVGLAFEGYLERFGPDQQRAGDLLTALAFAEGAGLPRQFWAPVASALCGTSDYADADIDWVVRAAADYLLTVPEHGRLVYRLYHEALAEHLRAPYPGPAPQRRLTLTMRGLVPATAAGQPDWEAADPYLRAHLASHAAAAGELDQLLADPGFLLSTDPGHLLRALPTAINAAAVQVARLYRSALHQLRDRPTAEAASYLELFARQARLDELADRIEHITLPRSWSVPWVRPSTAISGQVVGRNAGWVRTLAVTELDGRLVIVSGGHNGTLQVWDPIGQARIGQPLQAHSDPVTALAVAHENGRMVLVSGGEDKALRQWDLADLSPVGDTLHGHQSPITAVAIGRMGGQSVLVSAGGTYGDVDGEVWVWDAAGREGRRLLERQLRVRAVALTELGSGVAVVCGFDRGHIEVFDLADGSRIRTILPDMYREADGTWVGLDRLTAFGHIEYRENPDISSMVSAQLDDEAVLVAAYSDGSISTWNLDSGTLRYRVRRTHDEGGRRYEKPRDAHDPAFPRDGTLQVTTCSLNGRPIIVSAMSDKVVRAWDLASGAQIGRALSGHVEPIYALAAGESAGRPVAVSGDSRGEIRAWDLPIDLASDNMPPSSGHHGQVNTVVVGELPERPVAISGGADGTIRIWDLIDGAPLGMWSHGAAIAAVAAGHVASHGPVVLSGGGGMVCAWRLADGTPIGQPMSVRHGGLLGIKTVALGRLGGQGVAIAAGGNGSIEAWDLNSGRPIWEPTPPALDHQGKPSAIYSIATGELAGQPIIVSGGQDLGVVRVWDLTTGKPLGDPLVRPGDAGIVDAVAVGELRNRSVAVVGWMSLMLEGCEVWIWDLGWRLPMGTPLRGHNCGFLKGIEAVAIGRLAGRPMIVSGAEDETVRVWDPDTREPIYVIELPESCCSLAVGPSGICVVGTPQGLTALHFGDESRVSSA